MYSLAFLSCLLWFFELDKNGTLKWIAAWIPLYLIWINLHAGFLAGIGLFGAYWLEQLIRRRPHKHLILVGIAMIGLIAINPYGFDYYTYLWRAMTMPRPYIEEWSPIWVGMDLLHLSLFLLSSILFAYSVKKIGIRNFHGIALVIAAGLASIFSNRLVIFYALLWTCYVPGYLRITPLGNIMDGFYKKFSILLTGIFCAAMIALLASTLSLRPWKLLVPGDQIKKLGAHMIYPIGPVEYLSMVAFKGNLMVLFDWGSYVSWKLYPNVRVSMDSRYEVAYPEWVANENIHFYMAKEGWQLTLTKYPNDLVLVHKRVPLARVMHEQSGWKKVSTDYVFEFYARPGLTLPFVDWTGRSLKGAFP